MMNVKVAHDINILIIFYSLSGNTRNFANIIKNKLNNQGYEVHFHALDKNHSYKYLNFEQHNLIFIGSPTYGVGGTPNLVKDLLRHLLKENHFKLPPFAVFGTGETQYGEHVFCRAVDEIEYHLNKYKQSVIDKLKIEQNPVNKRDIIKIEKFVENVLRGI